MTLFLVLIQCVCIIIDIYYREYSVIMLILIGSMYDKINKNYNFNKTRNDTVRIT